MGEKSLNQRFYDREYAGAAETMLAAFEYFTPGWISDDRQAALRDVHRPADIVRGPPVIG